MATVLISSLPELQADNLDKLDNLIINDGADTTFSTSRVTLGALKQALFTNDSSDDGTGLNEFTGSVTVTGTGTSVTAQKFIGALEGDVVGNLTGTVTGNVTGDVTGDVTGTVTGNVVGDVTGNVTGEVSDISNHTLKALGDVADAMTPAANDVLAWSGSEWTSVTNPANSYTKAEVDNTFATKTELTQTLVIYAPLAGATFTGDVNVTNPNGNPVLAVDGKAVATKEEVAAATDQVVTNGNRDPLNDADYNGTADSFYTTAEANDRFLQPVVNDIASLLAIPQYEDNATAVAALGAGAIYLQVAADGTAQGLRITA